ncbi:MAG: peptidase T [Prolixibacteraceae bacterium]|jgi:tripeptide aminopeptidase|nr:peptidase T [Prolixibacteraceae bacterium]
MKKNVVDRFLKYVGYNTQSDNNSTSCPSTEGQLVFGKMLAEELIRIGMLDVEVDWNGYVMATLPANSDLMAPVVGFVAHMDTSPDCSGRNVRPRVIDCYDGNDILLNDEKNIVLSTKRFPEILKYKGEQIIVTDGTTLLGADDKAGLAEIVTTMEFLLAHPEIKHGKVRVAFTPDEEIGRGADHFYVPGFGADYAYTMDGGELGELQYENFNAASAHLVFHGVNVHPGSAKDKMRNSLLLANQFIANLPVGEVPEHTEKYEGFYHLVKFHGQVDKTELEFIIRDFDKESFEQRKFKLVTMVQDLNIKHHETVAEISVKDQYYNMKEMIDPQFYIVELAKEAMISCDVEPKVVPVRGGTDGSRLSYMGLPCPNIFGGGHNFHGEYEYIPTNSMESACRVIVAIISKVAGL